jgi:hypothetical protein
MQIVESSRDLFDDTEDGGVREELAAVEIRAERALGSVFEHEEDFLARFDVENFNQAKDIWMIDRSHNADFSLELSKTDGRAKQFGQPDPLYSIALAGVQINTEKYARRSTLPDFLFQ